MDHMGKFFKKICAYIRKGYPILIIALIFCALVWVYSQLDKTTQVEDEHYLPIIAIAATAVIVVNMISILLERYRLNEMDARHGIRDKNLLKFNQLIQYDKKRQDIEEEIGRLTRELMKSDISQYIDTNRLAFSGQNANLTSESNGRYDAFLKQFGLSAEAAKTKENTAVFLTPFNSEGHELFLECQAILGRVNIFLRQTSNTVDKDDILMNIITLIVQSELVLVNIDGRNHNVYYELGISHALGKPTILLSSADYTLDDIGFDIRQKRIIIYKDKKQLETELLYQIGRIKKF